MTREARRPHNFGVYIFMRLIHSIELADIHEQSAGRGLVHQTRQAKRAVDGWPAQTSATGP